MRALHFAFAVAAALAASVISTSAAEVVRYGAIAICYDGTKISKGVVWNSMAEKDAVEVATAVCRKSGAPRILFETWTDGCGFAATGGTPTKFVYGYSYGPGATPLKATAACQESGAVCEKPEGGCNGAATVGAGQ